MNVAQVFVVFSQQSLNCSSKNAWAAIWQYSQYDTRNRRKTVFKYYNKFHLKELLIVWKLSQFEDLAIESIQWNVYRRNQII